MQVYSTPPRRLRSLLSDMEQGKKGQHDLIIIISLKKQLIASICRELSEYFKEKVSESEALDKVKVLIEAAKSLQNDGNVYADVLNSLRMSKLDFS